MKHRFYFLLVFILANLGRMNAQEDQLIVADFEDLDLAPASFWFYNPEAEKSTFRSGSFSFNNGWSEYGGLIYWDAFAYSNLSLGVNDFADENAQFGSVAGRGATGSSTFATAFYSSFNTPVITLDHPAVVPGVYLSNNLYTYSSLINGDAFSGGPFEQGDFLKVIFTPIQEQEEGLTPPQVTFFLADYRSENAEDHYILRDWQWLDLSSLGSVSSLTFYFEGSRTGEYGLNTPGYLCLDNLGATAPSVGLPSVQQALDAAIYYSAGKLSVVSPADNYNVRVYSADGRLTHSQSGEKQTDIQASSWNNGAYIVEIVSARGRAVKKFIKY